MVRHPSSDREGAAALPDPGRNRLLAAFPAAGTPAWQAAFEPFQLRQGAVLYEPGSEVDHLYFPLSGIVAVLHVLGDGAATQVMMVGSEGAVGVQALMHDGPLDQRAVVQSAGTALRIAAATVRAECDRGGAALALLLRYLHALVAQIAHTAVCNRHHSPEQQLCRFLLLSLDRLETNEVVGTHEFIANILGLRRETITDAIGKVQARGAIRARRGRIQVLDAQAVERHACECYASEKREYNRLLLQLAEWRVINS